MTKNSTMTPPADESINTVVRSAAAEALTASLITIESTIIGGYAKIALIGNTTEICRDGKERAIAALEATDIILPPKKIIVSLTPAEVKKDGSHLDLPMAVSLALLANEQVSRQNLSRWIFAAELGLNGKLRPVKGIISFALEAMAHNLDGLVVAQENLKEINALSSAFKTAGKPIKAIGFNTLRDVLNWIYKGQESAIISPLPIKAQNSETHTKNFDDMLLTPGQIRAVQTVAVGMHSMLLRGPPGTGKSMLAQRIPSVMPCMQAQEHIESMRIHSSINNNLAPSLLTGIPPFRSPHHQASANAILGTAERPGELSMAHGGVLFLDEFPEFRRDLLESLREPLETGEIRVSRANRKVTWRGQVLLIAACNNCPCGWDGSRLKHCTCDTSRIFAYQNKMSGPILDRIDLHINMPERTSSGGEMLLQLTSHEQNDTTAILRRKIMQARQFQIARNHQFGISFNRDLQAKDIITASGLPAAEFAKMIDSHLPKGLGNRTMLRSLRVARTLADIDLSEKIREADIKQAQFWQKDQAALDRGQEVSTHTAVM